MAIISEIKRRKMFQVAAVYLVVAWLTMQVVDVIFTPLRLPEWFPTVVIVAFAIGFPLTMIISWAFNVTSTGVEREQDEAKTLQPSGRTIEFILFGLVGVAVIWLIYRTEFDTPTVSEPVVAQDTAPNVRPKSIAVLPFANLSPDPNNAFFAAGIHDTILNELAKVRDMHVISRTTMVRYAETELTMPEIADELRVETVMEGSVQYANGRVLVTAQLIDPRNDAHLWSENYDRDFSDIFSIQADIATRIAEAMQAKLSPEDRVKIEEQMTDSPEAYAYYMQAMELAFWDLSPGDNNPAIHRLLDHAIELDPEFARAYATKAHIYGNKESDVPLAIEFAERALELDSELGLTYDALGNMYKNQNRPAKAIEAISTAMKLTPNDPNTLDTAAQFYAQIGDAEEAHRIVDRLLELDPSFAFTKLLVAYSLGETDVMLPAAREAVKYDAHRLTRQLWLATLEHVAGNIEEAQLRLQIAEDLAPSNLGSFQFGSYSLFYSVLGQAEKAKYYYAKLVQLSEREFVRPAFWAMANVGVGNYEKALENLLVVADEIEDGWVSGGISSLVYNHYGDPMLETPEFVAARERVLEALYYE